MITQNNLLARVIMKWRYDLFNKYGRDFRVRKLQKYYLTEVYVIKMADNFMFQN